ncbi:MAG: VCBS repeat-containing protein [Gemmataceae bacterium]|nr:VCBS repeat-containing protein [Gemmataceae bacterium]
MFLTIVAVSLSLPTQPLSFQTVPIDRSLTVGYATALDDINGDGKIDILVVDSHRLIWFENPTWKLHTIIQGQSKPDNVCFAIHDIDGDGKKDIALGADWKPFNTKTGGTLQWLKQGQDIDQPWKLFTIAEEPTVHRIRFADIDGDGKQELILGPLMGKNSSRESNWMDGNPVRLIAYSIPANPETGRWTPRVLSESLHVMHNFFPIPRQGSKGMDFITATYEGVHRVAQKEDKWVTEKIGEGNQENLKGNRGASEIKQGTLADGRPYIATIEPWHGNQVVVYTPGAKGALWTRQVVDAKLKWGHGVWCADLDGKPGDELIIGVRDDLSPMKGERLGVRLYTNSDGMGKSWARSDLDEGGVAVEDLAAADVNGDGLIDIVAVGRATKNVKLYLNRTGK